MMHGIALLRTIFWTVQIGTITSVFCISTSVVQRGIVYCVGIFREVIRVSFTMLCFSFVTRIGIKFHPRKL